MITFRYGGKKGRKFQLVADEDLLVVRTRRGLPLGASGLSRKGRRLLEPLRGIVGFPGAGVEVLASSKKGAAAAARKGLKKEGALLFAGRVLCDPKSRSPVVYTENAFVKFEDDTTLKRCKALIKKYGLQVKRSLDYTHHGFFLGAAEGTGQAIFELCDKLLQEEEVELCHPELVRRMNYRGAFPAQWHLKSCKINGSQVTAHAAVESAWSLSLGEGTTIAVIDDGVDLDHEEFRSPGKIIAPRDATHDDDDPRPGSHDNHGTACAGVACADGGFGASGVAPRARLLPIRLVSGLGSQAEADAFVWAAKHGADVISCSWGPADGEWWNDDDPLHKELVPLPDSTRQAIDWAIRNGRNGKGCVITWAAGNGNESVDNDGYASYDKVIAVAACNDTNTRSVYSDKGDALWCAFPSSDFTAPKTPGIWTTDRSGRAGYNEGNTDQGDGSGNYTNSFGGTSSSCPGAAGVAALVLSRNPDLRWDQVKDILKRSCDRIDETGGKYDADGHSSLYGYGRLNAKQAVQLALPDQPRYTAIHTAVQDVPIKDLKTSSLAVAVGDTQGIKGIEVSVDIEHTYIGDLVVRLLPPDGSGAKAVVLHDRKGGGADNLKTTYDVLNTPKLADLHGKKPKGTWTLEVTDKEKRDQGKLRSFAVALQR